MTTIDTKTYMFDFGKYRGYSYEFVMNQNPSYIKWCVDVGSLELDEDDLGILEARLCEVSK